MANKLPIIVAGIVFVTALASSVFLFGVNIVCVDIIGDGYGMGTDSQPVVIGQSCNQWRFNEESNDLTTHTIFSTLLALALGIIAGGVAWISSWKVRAFVKKIGLILLMFVFIVIMLAVTSFAASSLSGGEIRLYETSGTAVILVCLIVSSVTSLALMYLLFKRRLLNSSSNFV